MMRFIVSLALIVLPLSSQGAVWRLTMTDVERASVAHASAVAAADRQRDAARARAAAGAARRRPSLSLDASYRYQTEIPVFRPSPLSGPIEMGAHNNYSIGPVISLSAWDGGALREQALSLSALADARTFEGAAARNQTRLGARLAFLQLQGALERQRLVADAVRLARAQERDIALRVNAGAAAQVDALASSIDVLNRRHDFQRSVTEVALALEDLLTRTGATPPADRSRPMADDVAADLPAGEPPSTLRLILDDEDFEIRFTTSTEVAVDHPERTVPARLAEAARHAARVAAASGGPTLQLAAKTSRDYPNGPVHESVHQNIISATARWPLYEGGRARREREEQEALARAADERRRGVEEDLRGRWNSARASLDGLTEQARLERRVVEERRRLAALTYEAYRAGRGTYLDVQSANLGLLQAQVQEARTRLERLAQGAWMMSLAEPGKDYP